MGPTAQRTLITISVFAAVAALVSKYISLLVPVTIYTIQDRQLRIFYPWSQI